MAEAGATPEPQIKQGKGPDALPWGEATQLNDAVGLIPPEEDRHVPSGDAEQFLYSPTDRPGEPVTQGQPYGAGANTIRAAYQSEDDVVHQVAAQVSKDPAAPKSLKAFAARALQGM